YYLDLGERLAARGDHVVYLSMRHPDNVPAGPEDWFVSGVDFREQAGWRDKLRRAARTISSTEAAEAAHRVVRRSRPAVAHLHNIYHHLSPSVIRAIDREGVGIVQTLHDYKLICPAYLLMTEGEICERCRGGRYHEALRHRCLLDSRAASFVAMVEAYLHRWRRTYQKIRTFLCPSRFMLEKVRSFGIDSSRLVHLPYFLPVDRYDPGPGDGGYYVYAGRLSREKGIATLLEAHARLPRKRVPLRILGDGPLRERLEERTRELGLEDVVFEGYQPADRLRATVRTARFTVVPSEWYENYPFAILEAFALGRPVVGTRIGGIPELVRDGETGWTAPHRDPDALAECLARMMNDPAKADEMGKGARAWVADALSPEKHLERLDAIYREAAR
ncbi:MAG: glycosyltransferase, partial [Candidatus Eisenbacteria bacterium]|nr:glycosyltransferase [Candidatus Latescibacterota bacterium]MBD3301109.1 glycosyltransferase [Candidatus Eisenbacteria bacterium]